MAEYAEIALIRGMSYLADAQASIAHNLANVDTAGFKRRTPVAAPGALDFQSELEQRLPTVAFRQGTVWAPGVLRETGSRFQVAIDGPYFLQVRGKDGRPLLTRDGELQLDRQARLVNRQGLPYLDTAGSEIHLRSADGFASDVDIAPDGRLSDPQGADFFGRLAIVAPADQGALQPLGGGLYRDASGNPPTPAPGAPLRQGYQEGSNVDSLQELVRMIGVQRSFAATQRALTSVGRIRESLAENLLR